MLLYGICDIYLRLGRALQYIQFYLILSLPDTEKEINSGQWIHVQFRSRSTDVIYLSLGREKLDG